MICLSNLQAQNHFTIVIITPPSLDIIRRIEPYADFSSI